MTNLMEYRYAQTCVNHLRLLWREMMHIFYGSHREQKKLSRKVLFQPADPYYSYPKITKGDSICFEIDGVVYLADILDTQTVVCQLYVPHFFLPLKACHSRCLFDVICSKCKNNTACSLYKRYCAQSCPQKPDSQNLHETTEVNGYHPSHESPQQPKQTFLNDKGNPSNTGYRLPTIKQSLISLAHRQLSCHKISIVLYKLQLNQNNYD